MRSNSSAAAAAAAAANAVVALALTECTALVRIPHISSLRAHSAHLAPLVLVAVHVMCRPRPDLLPQHLAHDLVALRPRERVCSDGCKRTRSSPGSWPLIGRGRERVAGLAAKRTFTIPCPWPLNPQVVNELLGWRPKERSPALAPGPLVCVHAGDSGRFRRTNPPPPPRQG